MMAITFGEIGRARADPVHGERRQDRVLSQLVQDRAGSASCASALRRRAHHLLGVPLRPVPLRQQGLRHRSDAETDTSTSHGAGRTPSGRRTHRSHRTGNPVAVRHRQGTIVSRATGPTGTGWAYRVEEGGRRCSATTTKRSDTTISLCASG